jgi:adenylosuccinate synthase
MSMGNLGHTVVSGLQWGDEGKGKIVDLLASDYDVVVRFNGGANAGHTVVVGDQKYPLHLVPCGILQPGKLAVVANGVVVDPEVLLGEVAELRERGVTVGDNFKISDRAHVVMPYHRVADGLMEAAIARSMGQSREIGTTGRGIGPCYSDKATRSTAVRFGDLKQPKLLAGRLEHIVRVKNATLGALAVIADVPFEPLVAADLSQLVERYADELGSHICDTSVVLHSASGAGQRILFEGANGFLLDVDHGTYPFVTSSNSSALGVYAGAGMPGSAVTEVAGVVKAYCSRVGGGPFPTEQDNEVGERIRRRGNEYGTTTGRPRRCGWLDAVALRYAVRNCGASWLAIMLLDVLAGFDELKVCRAYEIGRSEVSDFPASARDLEAATPVFDSYPGFSEEVTECRAYSELPEAAKAYIETIERLSGVPVRIVSVGPERTQTLQRTP